MAQYKNFQYYFILTVNKKAIKVSEYMRQNVTQFDLQDKYKNPLVTY